MTTEPVPGDLALAARQEGARGGLLRRIGRRLRHEVREAIPPTMFFFVGFNLIGWRRGQTPAGQPRSATTNVATKAGSNRASDLPGTVAAPTGFRVCKSPKNPLSFNRAVIPVCEPKWLKRQVAPSSLGDADRF
jgi:hypothetical protein